MKDITISPGLNKLFEEYKKPTQEREPNPEPPPPPIEEQQKATPESEPIEAVQLDEELIKATAEIVISMVDGVQTTTFTALANAKLNKRANEITGDSNGKVKLNRAVKNNSYNDAGSSITNIHTSQELELLELNENVQDFIKNLAFTDRQAEQILQPLMFVIRANGGQIPMPLLVAIGFGNAIGGNVAGLMLL